jgi:hypothetical protein
MLDDGFWVGELLDGECWIGTDVGCWIEDDVGFWMLDFG